MDISQIDWQTLQRLEESLWQRAVRFDQAQMDRLLAPDFFEYGRSGRLYRREEILAMPAREIPAVIPLPDFQARLLAADVAQVTYTSIVAYPGGQERARRSSIWSRTPTGWQLRFHQGTPLPAER